MKILTMTALAITFSTAGFYLSAQTAKLSSAGVGEAKHLFLDVHRLTPGIKPEAVAQAHQKDLAVEKKYGADFIKYWVAPEEGLVFCLASASDSESLRKTHSEAHGLLPDNIYLVEEGTEAELTGKKNLLKPCVLVATTCFRLSMTCSILHVWKMAMSYLKALNLTSCKRSKTS